MNIVGAATGSRGDVFPILAILQELAMRGHSATLAANWGYEDICARSGLRFFPLSTPSELERILHDIPILASRYRSLFINRYYTGWNRKLFDLVASGKRSETCLLVSSRNSLWADQIARRLLRIPALRLHVDLPLRDELTPQLPPGLAQRRLEAQTHREWRSAMSSLGLPDALIDLDVARRSAARGPAIALWPEWLTPGADPAGRGIYLGFMPPPLGIESAESGGTFDVAVFAGTEGTTDAWAGALINVAGRACQALGLRGIVLGGGQAACGHSACAGLSWVNFVSLEQVLTNARVVIHHGGIGTAAAALETGIPQIMIPRLFGQPSNAYWFNRAGLCSVVSAREWTVPKAAALLKSVLDGDSRRPSAGGRKIDRSGSLATACDFFEYYFSGGTEGGNDRRR